ncbi:ice-binding family protein [Pseudonocardia sp. H11422]|uniref:ice-binding family protein n=1 Tax=Pseudonocardia sp. H11422 TaxID=2835866 RepID=UPI00292D0D46|nr:ice-binding family protein [Pseudonocardia sp. H11422]
MKHSVPAHGMRRRRSAAALAGVVALSSAMLMLVFAGTAQAATTPVPLGTAASFAVLAGSEVTNTGPSIVTGDLGVHPGTAISGFPPGTVLGTQHSADAVAGQAKSDLVAAYNNAAGRPATELADVELGGKTLLDGVYHNGTLGLTGTLTLDGQGVPGAVWIFQADSTLITASNSRVLLVNGADACNVFWKIGSSATLGTDTDFTGTVMALASITVQTGATVDGRVLARNGAVTLDNNLIGTAGCPGVGGPPATTTPITTTPTTTTTTTTTTAEPTTTTTEPTTTTTEPTTTTTEPTTTTTEPTTTTTEPTTTTTEPTTTTTEPTTTTTEPTTTTTEPTTTTTEPTTTTTEPTTTTTLPTTTTRGGGGPGGPGAPGGPGGHGGAGGSDGTGNGGSGDAAGGGSGSGSGHGTVTIPRGHPETGAGGTSTDAADVAPATGEFLAAGVALAGAAVAAGHAVRRRRLQAEPVADRSGPGRKS